MTGRSEPAGPPDGPDSGPPPDDGGRDGRESDETGGRGEAYELVKGAVQGVLAENEEARRAHRALRERGMDEERASEEIARVLIAVMYHVGRESERVEEAGGGPGLRTEAFRRLAEGETAEDVFGS